jgi:hypothetical protein
MLIEMVDPRIMVAVLASMLLTATGLETGVNPGEITDSLPDGIGVGSLFEPQPDANSTAAYQVTARFSLNDTRQNLSLERAEVDVGASEVMMSSGRLVSNQSITLANFSGQISTSRPLEASGSVDGWSAGPTRFNGARTIEGITGSEGISAATSEPSRLTLSDVSGALGVDGARTRLSDSRDVVVRDFGGRISIDPRNNTLELNGSASAVQAGSLSYD